MKTTEPFIIEEPAGSRPYQRTPTQPAGGMASASRRMNVLHVASWFPTPERPGYGVFVQEHVRACSRKHTSSVLYVHRRQRHGYAPMSVRIDHHSEYDLVEIDYLAPTRVGRALNRHVSGAAEGHNHTKRSARSLRALVNLLQVAESSLRATLVVMAGLAIVARKGRPDLLHVHVFEAGLGAVVLGRLLRIPVVVTEHWSAVALGTLSRVERMQATWVYRHAAVVLPVSQSLAESISVLAPGTSCRPVPNAVDTSLFWGQQTEAHAQGVPTALLVANLVPVKGVDIVLYAAKLLKANRLAFRLVIVGEGPERQRLEELTHELGIVEIVDFKGRLPKPEVARLMRCCSFLVVSSLWETQSVAILEALCSGKRVLASAVGGIPELVTQGRGLLFEQGCAEELAEKMILMLRTEQFSGDVALAREAAATFGMEAIAQQLDNVYASVINRAHGQKASMDSYCPGQKPRGGNR